jgi:pimeloyl-ACP methyl ester carboxylesterase
MFGPETKRRHPERIRAFVDRFASFDPAAAATTTRSVTTRFPGLADVLPRLRVPTTILLGADDRLYTVDRMEPIARLAPDASIRVVPGCGHLMPIEAPEAVVDALGRLRG